MKFKSAIILLTYRRIANLHNIINIVNQSNIDSYIFHDKFNDKKNKNENLKVKSFLKNLKNKKLKIYFRNKNYGLKQNYLSAMKYIFDKGYDSIIYLEDDLLVADNFIKNILFLIERFKKNDRIFSVSCNNFELDFKNINYEYDVFFTNRPNSYGFATWREKWLKFYNETDFNSKLALKEKKDTDKIKKYNFDIFAMMRGYHLKMNNSIGVWWSWYIIKNDYVCVNTKYNYIENLGYDGLGENLKYKKQDLKKKILVPNIKKEIPDIIFDKKIIYKLKDKFEYKFLRKILFNFFTDYLLLVVINLIKIKGKYLGSNK